MAAQPVFRLRGTPATWSSVDGETVLLDLTAARYLGVNRSGSLLWQSLAAGATADDLVHVLTAEYGLGADEASSDVQGFLAECEGRGLLTIDEHQ